jgi:hypothetical protein
MHNVYLRYALLLGLVAALGFSAPRRSVARQPQTAVGPAPGKLPDVLGLTTGMPMQQAIDLMKAHDPSHNVIIREWIAPQAFGDKPAIFQVSTATTGDDDTLDVNFTLPPQPQVVWGIHRTLGGRNRFSSTLTNVLNGLYQKYGTPWNPNPQFPLNPGVQQWFFTEEGQRVNPTTPPDMNALKMCMNTMMQAWEIFLTSWEPTNQNGKAVQMFHVPPRTAIVNMPAAFDPAKNPNCNNLVYVHTQLNGGGSVNDSILQFSIDFSIEDDPLQHRTVKPLNDMLNAAAQRGIQQQQSDQSKLPLPQL